MPDNPYAAHQALVAPARARPELWRLFLGLVVAGIVAFGLNSALQAGLLTFVPDFWMDGFVQADTQGGTPASLLVLLFSFVFVTISVMVASQLVQRRAPWGLIGPLRPAVLQFWRVLRVLVLIGFVVVLLPPYDMGAPLEPNLALGQWLVLLPFSLLAVLVQTSAEEILFRGYIQQQLAARFASPLIWMVVPSALFAMGHYLPAQAGENALFIALWAGVFGLLMADLTARAGTLGPAIAVHFINNVSALLIVSVPDSLSGLSLFTVPYGLDDADAVQDWLPVDFAMMLVSWLAARLAIRR